VGACTEFRGSVARSALALAGAITLISPLVSAQTLEQRVSAHRFAPAPGPRNLIVTRGVRTAGTLAYGAGVIAAYAHEPFTVTSCPAGATACSDTALQTVNVVDRLVSVDLLASFSPWQTLQLGLRLPVAFVSGEGLADDGQPDPGGRISKLGLADAELELKLRAFGELKDPTVLGFALALGLPSGKGPLGGAFTSNGAMTFAARGIVDLSFDALSLIANLTPTAREQTRLGTTVLGSELEYSAGGAYAFSEAWQVVLDAFGATRFSGDAGSDLLEVDGALRALLAPGWSAQLGGGLSPIQGIGAPTFRAFVGLAHVAEVMDRDGDGLADDVDRCPQVEEDLDGHEDKDGCPDLDEDGDKVLGTRDRCPLDPEDVDDFEDSDGCPDPDNDMDGLFDDQDRCPRDAENRNGFQDHDGCPDKPPDTDHDGLLDAEDRCPSEPEDTDGFDDQDGCVDPDNDEDGVLDGADECPDTKEVQNGRNDSDGCPD